MVITDEALAQGGRGLAAAPLLGREQEVALLQLLLLEVQERKKLGTKRSKHDQQVALLQP